jgi:hypothetical protein
LSLILTAANLKFWSVFVPNSAFQLFFVPNYDGNSFLSDIITNKYSCDDNSLETSI